MRAGDVSAENAGVINAEKVVAALFREDRFA